TRRRRHADAQPHHPRRPCRDCLDAGGPPWRPGAGLCRAGRGRDGGAGRREARRRLARAGIGDRRRAVRAPAARRRDHALTGVGGPLWAGPDNLLLLGPMLAVAPVSPARIIGFWQEAGAERWFGGGPAFDAEIAARFTDEVTRACRRLAQGPHQWET